MKPFLLVIVDRGMPMAWLIAATVLAQDPQLLESKALEEIDGFVYPNFKREDLRQTLEEIARLPSHQRAPLMSRLVVYAGRALESTREQLEQARAAAGSKKARGQSSEEAKREIEIEEKRVEILSRRFPSLFLILSELGSQLKGVSPGMAKHITLEAYNEIQEPEARRQLVASISSPQVLSTLICGEGDRHVVAQIALRLKEFKWVSEPAIAVLFSHAQDLRNTRRVRAECVFALAQSAGRSDVPRLIELLKDPATQYPAHLALIRITGAELGPTYDEWIGKKF